MASTVTNGSNLSYAVEATTDDPAAGASSNSNIMANFAGGLPVGTQSSSTFAALAGNNQVMFQGTVVPEPGTTYLFGGAAGLLIMLRFRRAFR